MHTPNPNRAPGPSDLCTAEILLSNTTSNSQPNAQPSSRLFDIAPELRNHIYDLAFAETDSITVALHLAKPPSNALLLTCKAVHGEAKGIYAREYRRYWTETHFQIPRVLESPFLFQVTSGIKNLKAKDVFQIRSLSFAIHNDTTGDQIEHLYKCPMLHPMEHVQPYVWRLVPVSNINPICRKIRNEFALHLVKAHEFACAEYTHSRDALAVPKRQLVMALEMHVMALPGNKNGWSVQWWRGGDSALY